jgi:AbrB family looped-hinge helix DNA binding protein
MPRIDERLPLNDTLIDRSIVKGDLMTIVTVSPKYQIVIPKSVRESLGIQVGQKMHVFQYGDHVQVIPQRPIQEARGMFPGIDTDVPRDPDRV